MSLIDRLKLVIIIFLLVGIGYVFYQYADIKAIQKENAALVTAVADSEKNAVLQQQAVTITKDTIVETYRQSTALEKKAAVRQQATNKQIEEVKQLPGLSEEQMVTKIEEINLRSVWEEYCATVGVEDAQCKIELKSVNQDSQENKHEESE